MKRFAIFATEWRSGVEVQVCACDSYEGIKGLARAVQSKRRKGKPAYVKVRVVDREAGEIACAGDTTQHAT
jgi:hypothetical protein